MTPKSTSSQQEVPQSRKGTGSLAACATIVSFADNLAVKKNINLLRIKKTSFFRLRFDPTKKKVEKIT